MQVRFAGNVHYKELKPYLGGVIVYKRLKPKRECPDLKKGVKVLPLNHVLLKSQIE